MKATPRRAGLGQLGQAPRPVPGWEQPRGRAAGVAAAAQGPLQRRPAGKHAPPNRFSPRRCEHQVLVDVTQLMQINSHQSFPLRQSLYILYAINLFLVYGILSPHKKILFFP